MKMRHFWRWPVLFTILFGFAQAGSTHGFEVIPMKSVEPGSSPMDTAAALDRETRTNAGMAVIRTALNEARSARIRAATLRRLADVIDTQTAQLVEIDARDPAVGTTIQPILASLFAGADALRSRDKATRRAGMAYLDDALHEYDVHLELTSWKVS